MMSKITITIEPASSNLLYGLADKKPVVIKLGRRYNFAVVAPAHYRVPVTRHVDIGGVIRRVKQLLYVVDGVKVVDRHGRLGALIGEVVMPDKSSDPRIRISVHSTV